jgi:hypothetical protein
MPVAVGAREVESLAGERLTRFMPAAGKPHSLRSSVIGIGFCPVAIELKHQLPQAREVEARC